MYLKTSKNPASVSDSREGLASLYIDTCCRTEAGDLIMSKTHGLGHTSIYKRWAAMLQRCYNPEVEKYAKYGGRGIVVCDEWLNDFKAYYDYVMSLDNAMNDGLTIDRKENDGNYEPGNMRWATKHVQSANRGININNKSGYRGVCFSKRIGKWRSVICVCGRQICLGTFNTPEEARDSRLRYIKENNLVEYSS